MGLAKRRSWGTGTTYGIADPALVEVLGMSTFSGETVNECTALNLSAIYRAVSLIAGSIATLPLRSVESDDQGRKTRKSSWLDNPYGPDYEKTQYEWVETVVANLVLHGNAFLFKLFNGAGAMVGGIPIHPSCVEVEVDDTKPGKRLYKVNTDDNGVLELTNAEILHIPGLSFDGVRGYSLLYLARNSIGIALAGDKSAGAVLKNGPKHSVLITPNEDLTEEEAEAVTDSVRNAMAGPDNAGKIISINRALSLSPFTMSYADAQFLETRVFQIEEIARWTGLPPHLLGLTEKQTSFGTGVAEQNLGLSRFTLNPITSRIEQRLSRLLGPKVKAEFDYSGFLRPAPTDEITLVIAEMNAGLITPNEARAIRNMPAIEGQDELRLPPGSLPPGQMEGEQIEEENSQAGE